MVYVYKVILVFVFCPLLPKKAGETAPILEIVFASEGPEMRSFRIVGISLRF